MKGNICTIFKLGEVLLERNLLGKILGYVQFMLEIDQGFINRQSLNKEIDFDYLISKKCILIK